MRNSILSRPPLAGHSSQASNPNRARSPTFDDPTPIHHDAPTIRFISSTPANSSSSTRDAASFAASTSLAPRQGEPSRRRRRCASGNSILGGHVGSGEKSVCSKGSSDRSLTDGERLNRGFANSALTPRLYDNKLFSSKLNITGVL